MKIWKRAWVSITRRKLNSLILLLIVFILANVLLTTLTVKNSLSGTKEMVLQQFPPVVTIDYNNENYTDKTPKLTPEMADTLYSKTKDLVKNYDYTIPYNFEKDPKIKYSELPGFDETNKIVDDSEPIVFTDGTQLPTTNLVAKGEAKLISGKGFSKADIQEGNPKVIVSKQFAETNQLQVGSYLPVSRVLRTFDKEHGVLTDPYFSEDIDLEIVGIIEIDKVDNQIKKQASNPTKNANDLNQIQNLSDTIYVPNNFIRPLIKDNIERAKEKDPGGDTILPGSLQSVIIYPEFILNDMKDLNTFLKKAKTVFNEKDYTIKSVASEYEVIAGPLNSMEDLMDLVFKISLVANIVVLTLVLYIFMYLRQKEMGVFLALGERRSKIIRQLIMETLTIALIGATLAIFTSMIFSNMLTDSTINNLLAPAKDLGHTVLYMNSGYGVTPEMISQQVQGGFSIITLVIFYLIIIGTILLSQIATILYLIRLNPKKILM